MTHLQKLVDKMNLQVERICIFAPEIIQKMDRK
jgi:hypothetical protein